VLRILVAAFVALCILYNVTLPIFEAPDEISHFTYAAWLARERRLPNLNAELPAHEAAQPPLYYLAAAAVVAPFDTSDLPQIGRLNPDWFDQDVNADFVSVRNLHLHTDAEAFPWRGAVAAVHAARALSTLLGAATVVLVYAIARLLRPAGGESFAAFVAALVAFNPKFVHISSIVTNDAAIIFSATLTFWWIGRLLARARMQAHDARDFGVLGAFLGVAVLSKLGGFALGAPALGAVFHTADRRRIITRLLAVGFGFLAVCGPWFLWNTLSYGDPLAFERVRAANASLLRETPLDVAAMLATGPRLFTSYFGVIGIDLSLPQPALDAYTVGFFAALLGCIALVARVGRRMRDDRLLIALVLGQIALTILFVPWLRSYIATENGRLLMPGVAALAALTALGWRTIMPSPLRRPAAVLVVAALAALCAATPFAVILPNFATPSAFTEEQILTRFGLQPSNVVFGGKVKLLHAALATARPAAGEPVQATVYWGAVAPIEQSYRAILELRDADGVVVAQRWFIPFGGRFDTQRWRTGEFFADEYALTPPPAPYDRILTLQVALRRVYGEPPRIPIDGANGADAFVVGRVRIAADPAARLPARARFGDVLALNDMRVRPGSVRFDWTALAAPPTDYTLFVHVYDAAGNRIAQQDAQPFDGAYPTSLWLPDEFVRDERAISLPPEAHELRFGWYDAASGARLPATKPDGSAWADGVAEWRVDSR
jgi:hypothetical protein